MSDDTSNTCPLLELSWEDLLFVHILPHLAVEDLFRLRATSKLAMTMMEQFFARTKRIDLTNKKHLSLQSFKVRDVFCHSQAVTSSCLAMSPQLEMLSDTNERQPVLEDPELDR